MELVYGKQPLKQLRRMQPKVSKAIRRELQAIANDPFAKHANVTTLQGVENGFRLRHGDWRALYRIDTTQQRMFVEKVRPRGDVYK